MDKKCILFLAQHFITLYSFRRELIERLCKEGHEVYLKSALTMGLANLKLSVGELRRRLYAMGYLLIGLRKGEESFNCSDEKEEFSLAPADRLILIGEE